MKNFSRRVVLAAAGASLVPLSAHAQTGWPDHTLRFVGGFPPGGPADLSGRMLAQGLGESPKELPVRSLQEYHAR